MHESTFIRNLSRSRPSRLHVCGLQVTQDSPDARKASCSTQVRWTALYSAPWFALSLKVIA